MTYEERTKLEGELMTRGIFLSNFISSSTYDAVVKILHESKQASTNTLLAVSGQLLSVRVAAVKYADTKWKNRDEWLTEYNQSIADFEAGAQWLISQAACTSGGVDTVAAGGDEKCTCPDDQCLLGYHPICRWAEYARKSSEGQP